MELEGLLHHSLISFKPILIFFLPSRPHSNILPSIFPYKGLSSYYVLLVTPRLVHFDFIRLELFGDEYTQYSPSLCIFYHRPFAVSLLGPNIFLNTLFSNTLNSVSELGAV
jgi:hypothetical protein